MLSEVLVGRARGCLPSSSPPPPLLPLSRLSLLLQYGEDQEVKAEEFGDMHDPDGGDD